MLNSDNFVYFRIVVESTKKSLIFQAESELEAK